MRRLVLPILVLAVLIGCVTPGGPQLGPPPAPILSTRAPDPVVPIPPRQLSRSIVRPPFARPIVGKTIVIDAGHGGRDPGALGVGPSVEKDVNLAVARLVAAALRTRGANVIMSRDTDRFIPLNDRAALAERSRADLFVSIHADASRRSSVRGATVYIARVASSDSERAASRIVSAFEDAGIECRGVRRAGFRVLVGHSRPAVLVECGFLTNRAEAVRLATSSYQRRLADALVEAIARTFSS